MQVYLYTGEGAGKTTNALGLALRSIGHKKKVVIVQFMKWWKNLGELKFAKIKSIKRYYSIYQFGRPGWLKIREGMNNIIKINGKKFKVRSVQQLDRIRCLEGIKFTKQIVKKQKPHLLVLDEIVLANYLKLISFEEIVDLLKFIKKYNNKCSVVMTGRYASKQLIDLSDYANEISIIKMPKKLSSIPGVQY